MIGFAIQSEGILRLFVVPINSFVCIASQNETLLSRPNDRADRCFYASSTLFHFIFLRDAPRNDRGFEETVRDSGHRVDGT